MTSIEAGYQDSDYNFWNGLLAPARTPRAIIDRLHDGVAAVLAMPDVQQRLAAEGVDPQPATPEEFDAQIRSEIAVNLKIAKAAGLGDN
jgi:tripartite-type tricarboxylate transporter receptor subunit TctC